MKPTQRSLADGESGSGSVNVVLRDGSSVLRPMKEYSKSIHELLQFLESSGFQQAPRFMCTEDNEQKERLSYLQGEVALHPWPETLCSLSGLEQIANMLKRYHELVEQFVPSRNTWHLSDRETSADTIIRHGDIGPWNMVWENDQLVGLIDWDFAEPGTVLEDLAQTAWHSIPLKSARQVEQAGVLPENQKERLHYFCDVYGVSTEEVLNTLPSIHAQEIDRMNRHGAKGIEPWASFLNRGDVQAVKADAEWLAANLERLS